MRIKPSVLKKLYAGLNAREGLISVADLSLLTGVPPALLTSFAKKGLLGFYGEYQGKRFFNFKEIIDWLNAPGPDDEAKVRIRANMKVLLKGKDSPFSIEEDDSDGTPRVRIVWKEFHPE